MWFNTGMRTPRAMAILLLAICAGSAQTAASATHLQYVSPLPGSARIFPETNIVIRAGGHVDPSTVQDALLTVTGSRSGVHPGTIRLSDDGETIVFLPVAPFSTGEVVTCHLGTGLRTDRRGSIASEDFSFSIVGQEEAELRRSSSRPLEINDLTGPGCESRTAAGPAFRRASTDTLPADVPAIQVTTPGTPSPGLLFLSDFKLATTGYKSYLMILRNDGSPLFYRKLNGLGADFKVQPDGRLTYFDSAAMGFYAMNPLYAVVDSFRCGNGYTTDLHELRLLPNGHALLMSYDVQTVDMSAVVPGGNPAARVTGLIIQELDLEKNVVFQWRSWDHFQITDAPHLDLTAASIDYVHGNAIESDRDGNLLISCRHMDEITKIDRSTGEVIWRLGGKNNQFTFVNDADGFTYQHAVRRIANGDITLFDNGNFHSPCFSRAVEHALDEGAKTATLVWQYRHVPDVCGFALGYAQRLPSGNTLICWGATNPTLTEVSPDGTLVQELTFPTAIVSYRGYRQEWPPLRDA